jgi:hypothetical protein
MRTAVVHRWVLQQRVADRNSRSPIETPGRQYFWGAPIGRDSRTPNGAPMGAASRREGGKGTADSKHRSEQRCTDGNAVVHRRELQQPTAGRRWKQPVANRNTESPIETARHRVLGRPQGQQDTDRGSGAQMEQRCGNGNSGAAKGTAPMEQRCGNGNSGAAKGTAVQRRGTAGPQDTRNSGAPMGTVVHREEQQKNQKGNNRLITQEGQTDTESCG